MVYRDEDVNLIYSHILAIQEEVKYIDILTTGIPTNIEEIQRLPAMYDSLIDTLSGFRQRFMDLYNELYVD